MLPVVFSGTLEGQLFADAGKTPPGLLCGRGSPVLFRHKPGCMWLELQLGDRRTDFSLHTRYPSLNTRSDHHRVPAI